MNILKWVLIGLISFVLAAGGMLGVMIFLKPPPEKDKTTLTEKNTNNKKEGKFKSSEKETFILRLKEYKAKNDRLKIQVDSIKIVNAQQKDELQNKDKELKKLAEQLTGKADKDSRAKDIAKTLSSMKVKKIAPILAKLDDQTVIDIYRQMSSTNRKNILLGLSGERAAKVAKKLINP